MTSALWRKSSYSGPNGGDCVEIADGLPGVVPVRDSKDPDGPVLVFSVEAFADFIASVKKDLV
ncbi:DUF397 domain-containing protein [Kitasatospora sp. NPDC052896]|uniref:DUF397 domain-containing protein n=1 Tax=Kitasatospora sp. NPDC052896 TaxID=3364061 RepID=UPI0037CB2D83